MTDRRVLDSYLNDHLMAATGGVDLFRRAAASHRGSSHAELSRLADEVAEDRRALRALMRRLGVPVNRPLLLVGRVAERVGRLKPNGTLLRRSPFTDVVELESLRIAVQGKLAGWQVLRAATVSDDRLDRVELEDLIERAEDQADRLYTLHLRAAEDVLGHRPTQAS